MVRHSLRNNFADPYEYHIDICNESCSSGRPAVLRAKTLVFDITRKLFYQIFSYLPFLVGSIDFH